MQQYWDLTGEGYSSCFYGFSKAYGWFSVGFFDVLFLDNETGWTVGDRIVSTTSGYIWNEERPLGNAQIWLRRIRKAGDHLVVVGDGGTILRRPLSTQQSPIVADEIPSPPDSVWTGFGYRSFRSDYINLRWNNKGRRVSYHMYVKINQNDKWNHVMFVGGGSGSCPVPTDGDFFVALTSVVIQNGQQIESEKSNPFLIPKALYADFIGNGIIDMKDYTYFEYTFGTTRNDWNFNYAYDLNDDGVIDLADFFIFADNYGKKAEQCFGCPITQGDKELKESN